MRPEVSAYNQFQICQTWKIQLLQFFTKKRHFFSSLAYNQELKHPENTIKLLNTLFDINFYFLASKIFLGWKTTISGPSIGRYS